MESGELVIQILSVMAEIFDKSVSNNMLTAYYEALKDEPSEAVKQAATEWIRTGTRFPYPAELLALVKKGGESGSAPYSNAYSHTGKSPVEKVALRTAIGADEQNPVKSDVTKDLVGNGAATPEPAAPAGFAENGLARHLLLRARLLFHVGKIRTQRLVLGLKIGALALQCRVLRLNEPKTLLEDRRRAVFVDQFLEKLKHRKFSFRPRLPVIDGGEKTLPLIDASRRCWEGRIGENEILPMVEQMTAGFSERQLKHAIALLLNDISRYGRPTVR